jgi:hypothetical protein
MSRVALVIVLFALCAGLVGCGPKEPAVHPVSGTVKFADGKPAVGCVVEFTSQAEGTAKMNATGEVQADGTYQLKTNVNGKLKDGAVVGPHTVIVVPPSASSSGPPPITIPTRYSEADKSGLKFDVQPGNNDYPITLQRN